MTERKMSVKGFLHKCNTKAANSALGFLKAYREYLTTGELANVVAPILDKIDNGELMPTPGLAEIKLAAATHLMTVAIAKAQADITKVPEAKVEKSVEAVILNAKNEEVAAEGFELSQRAIGWVDRRLFENPGCHGVIRYTKLTLKPEIIKREDSMLRLFPRAKSPVMKRSAKSSGRLGFGVKAKQSHASFSRG